jgi:hypothetical protein
MERKQNSMILFHDSDLLIIIGLLLVLNGFFFVLLLEGVKKLLENNLEK